MSFDDVAAALWADAERDGQMAKMYLRHAEDYLRSGGDPENPGHLKTQDRAAYWSRRAAGRALRLIERERTHGAGRAGRRR